MKNKRILSLDISSVSTGWSIYDGKNFICGTILLDKKIDKVIKLNKFRKVLKDLLIKAIREYGKIIIFLPIRLFLIILKICGNVNSAKMISQMHPAGKKGVTGYFLRSKGLAARGFIFRRAVK